MTAEARAIPIIRPITDMRTKFNDVCRQATEEQEPIILTKNGTAAYLLFDCDAYEAERQSDRVRMALREAEKRHGGEDDMTVITVLVEKR